MHISRQLLQNINRLIVFPGEGSSGVWAVKRDDNALVMVEHDFLGMPLQLSNGFKDFVRWTVDAFADAGNDDLNAQYIEKGKALAKALAFFVGDACQVEFLNRRVLSDLGIEPLSREFIFDRCYALQRNKRDFFSPLYPTYLAVLLRNEMSSEDRERIFPGKFDLGNEQTVPTEQCTDTLLAKELSIDSRDRPFKSIYAGIPKLLGRDVSWYLCRNPSTTYKVVKLLYQTLRSRHSRLFHFLKLPEYRRYSLEFRGDTPFVDGEVSTEEAVWLIADLKTYLSLELEEHAYVEIQTMLDELPQLLERFRHGTEQVFVEAYDGDYANACAAYVTLAEDVKRFTSTHEQQEIGLDEELCIYVRSLEFFHFSIGAPKFFQKAIPSGVTITPVIEELYIFTSGVYPSVYSVGHLHIPCLSLDDVPNFIRKNREPMLAILKKAMGSQEDWVVSDEVIADVHSAVHNLFCFQYGKLLTEVDTQSQRVSPWLCVAALCCVWHMKKNPLSHKPYLRLMSQNEDVRVKEPTRSLIKALKNSQHELVVADSMMLEHRLIWRHRLEWFSDSLIGQSELMAPKFRYRVALTEKLMEILRENRDRGALELAVNDFYDFVKSSAFKISGTTPV